MSFRIIVTVVSLLFVSCCEALLARHVTCHRSLSSVPVGLPASLSDDNTPQVPREKDPAMETLRGMLLASLVSVQILGGSGLPAIAALSISDRATVRRAELNKLVGDNSLIDKTNIENAVTQLTSNNVGDITKSINPEAYQNSISKGFEKFRMVAAKPESSRTTVEIPEQFKIKSDVQDAVRSGFDVMQGIAKEGVQAAVNVATTAASSPEAKGITTSAAAVVQKNFAVVLDQLDAVGGSEFISSVGKDVAAVSSIDNIPASVQSNIDSIITNLQQTGSTIGSKYIQPRIDAVVSEIQPQINQVLGNADEQWKQVRDIRMSQVLGKLAETLSNGADSTAAFLVEQAKNVPPVSYPENMKLLSTTVRGPPSGAVQTPQATGATWEDVVTAVKGIQTGVKIDPGRMQTVLDDIESLKTLASSALADLSQIRGPVDLKALAATVDWRTCAGFLGFLIIADAFQKGAFLGSVVERQAIELMEKRRLLEQAGADSEAVSSLQMESLTLLQEVDLLIKQLAEKSAEVDSLSDTIQTLSAASSTEASRASRLEEELSQIRKELSAALQEMAAASTAAAASATAAAAKAVQTSSTAVVAPSTASLTATLSSELEAVGQWQRRMSTAVRNAMSAQGRAIPTSELPEAFSKWQASRTDSQSQELSQQLQSAANKLVQLEQTVTESHKAAANSATQLVTTEEQLLKVMANSQYLSQQLQASTERLAQLERNNVDAQQTTAQWQRRMSTAVRSVMSAQGLSVPTSELPEAFSKWQASRTDSQSQELSQQLQSAANKLVQLEQTITESQKAAAILKEQSATQLRAAEEQVANEKTKAEQLSTQLLSSEMKISQLTRSVTDAEKATEMLKDQSSSRLRATEEQLASEKATAEELSRQVRALSEAATTAADRAKSFSEEMTAKFSAMNTRVELLVKENAELTVKIAALEEKKAEDPAPVGAQQIISQLTSQNDDLKLRLLTSDERLFDIQEDMQKKLDSAKSVAKELNARLTEKTVQLESKEGMLMERVKELETTNSVTQKTLQETQDMLQSMAAAAATSTRPEVVAAGDRDSALMKRVLKAKATALQIENVSIPPSTAPSSSSFSSASDAAAAKSSKTSMLSLSPAQIKKKTKKELEDMLAALNVSHDPVSGKKVKDLAKPGLLALFEAQLQDLG